MANLVSSVTVELLERPRDIDIRIRFSFWRSCGGDWAQIVDWNQYLWKSKSDRSQQVRSSGRQDWNLIKTDKWWGRITLVWRLSKLVWCTTRLSYRHDQDLELLMRQKFYGSPRTSGKQRIFENLDYTDFLLSFWSYWRPKMYEWDRIRRLFRTKND